MDDVHNLGRNKGFTIPDRSSGGAISETFWIHVLITSSHRRHMPGQHAASSCELTAESGPQQLSVAQGMRAVLE